MKLSNARLARLESFIQLENDHWLWQGAKDKKGYGMSWNGKKYRRAHLVFFEHFKGDIPEGLEVDHLCRVRNCVNPEHLEAVTHAENIRRGQTGIVNRSKTHCTKGHAYTPENTFIHRQRRQCKTCRRQRRNEWGKQNREHLNAKRRKNFATCPNAADFRRKK